MADQQTVESGPSRRRSTASRQQSDDSRPLEELGVYGRALVETQSTPGKTSIRLHGLLDLDAAEKIDRQQLCPAMQSSMEVCLDVSELTGAQPEALKLLLDRQRSGQRGGQRLAIRISPAQVPSFFP